jgi:FO synthase
MRRALRRASDAATLNIDEISVLLAARDEELTQLCEAAARVRDAGLIELGRPGVITFSPKVFIPLTRLCRDRCHYCTFATTPNHLPAAYLEISQVVEIAKEGAKAGCLEALFTLGDRPEDRWDVAVEWLSERGYSSTLDYLRACAIAVLEETGLLPHLNPGVMSFEEMSRLRPVAASMGMMLETSSSRLFTEKGEVHFGSPDKDPAVRLRTIEDAGKLNIPFTTGILVGIGETIAERADSLLKMAEIAKTYGHIQEIIIQNFRAKEDTAMRNSPDADRQEYLACIAVARLIFGPRMRIQAPPNLSEPSEFAELISAGIDDWGGVSPITADHVNPERPWPEIELLAKQSKLAGFELKPRLTIYSNYVLSPERWVDPKMKSHIATLADAAGLAKAKVIPVGMPWQESGESLQSLGRTDLGNSIDTTGREADSRSDFDSIYGNWQSISEKLKSLDTSNSAFIKSSFASALSKIVENPRSISRSEALTLFAADGPELELLVKAADEKRAELVGDDVTYIVNRNINFTNVCYTGCRFCAFAQRKTDADSYLLSIDEIKSRVNEAWLLGANEVCMQAGIHPDLSGDIYFEVAKAVKEVAPDMHIHAFSPMEIFSGAIKLGISYKEWLERAKAAGLGTIPGTAAEILDDEIRWILTKGKLPAKAWLEIVREAHLLGIKSSATMMYGHVDNESHWYDHILTIRNLQDETGGFTEFVPLPFVHYSSPIYLAGVARPGPTIRENRVVHAMARLLLAGSINNIQCSWVKLGLNGPDGVLSLLAGGVNDIGGTLMEETISRMAGSTNGSLRTVVELEEIAQLANRPARQRTTTYGPVRADREAISRRANVKQLFPGSV